MAIITVKNKVLQGGVHNMTSPYGMRTHPVTGKQKLHEGIDLTGKNGADFVVAFAAGRVSRTGYDESAGYFVKIDHGNQLESVYFHLRPDSITVREGAQVEAGATLAYMGASGQVTGVHLHFGLKRNGKYLDPRPFLEGKQALEEEAAVFRVGERVTLTGRYAAASTAQSAAYAAAIGQTAYVAAVYPGRNFPYQISKVLGEAANRNTLGFADAGALKAAAQQQAPAEIHAGDKVRFTGGSHYKASDSLLPSGGMRTAGQAVVKLVKRGAKHPYHLIGTTSNVWGWVNATQIQAI